MLEFDVADQHYRSGRLDAFRQLHIARKLAPLIAKLSPQAANPDANDFFSLMAPVIDGLAEMPEDDVNYITQRCLSVVQRQQGQQWAPVWNDTAKRLMFDDIDAMQLLQISFQVISDQLGSFMRAPLSSLASPSPQSSEVPGNLSAFPTTKAG